MSCSAVSSVALWWWMNKTASLTFCFPPRLRFFSSPPHAQSCWWEITNYDFLSPVEPFCAGLPDLCKNNGLNIIIWTIWEAGKRAGLKVLLLLCTCRVEELKSLRAYKCIVLCNCVLCARCVMTWSFAGFSSHSIECTPSLLMSSPWSSSSPRCCASRTTADSQRTGEGVGFCFVFLSFISYSVKESPLVL